MVQFFPDQIDQVFGAIVGVSGIFSPNTLADRLVPDNSRGVLGQGNQNSEFFRGKGNFFVA